MSKALRTTFLVHAVVAGLAGLVMLIIPGRFLLWLAWAPIDPIVSRLFGAALLALAWSSFRGWRANAWEQVAYLVELEVIFTVLGCMGLLRHLLFGHWPVAPWLVFALLLAFALAWIAFLALERRRA